VIFLLNRYKEAVYGVVFLILAAAYYSSSFSIKVYRGYGDAGVDSRFFPQLLAVFLILLSALQIINELKRAKSDSGTTDSKEPIFGMKVILTIVLIVMYIALMPVVGFLIMTALYLFCQIALLMPAGKRNYLLSAKIAVIFSICVYFLFVQVLSLILPRGILG
jgi:putative tricarboxylic transport membrane protein